VYFTAFESLVEFYESKGLTGHALDCAVRDALPSTLLELVGNEGRPH
jgi:hypothetical protein